MRTEKELFDDAKKYLKDVINNKYEELNTEKDLKNYITKWIDINVAKDVEQLNKEEINITKDIYRRVIKQAQDSIVEDLDTYDITLDQMTDEKEYTDIVNKYMESSGEGNTMASQMVTCVSNMIGKWFRNEDIYDNRFKMNWDCNSLSSYANWLYVYVPEVREYLNVIPFCGALEYEDILLHIVDTIMHEDFISKYIDKDRTDESIYRMCGRFRVVNSDRW